jgi:hypothetical protein
MSGMDKGNMKQRFEDLASVSEIVAAIGVILSLVFVGFQIRDGNRETRAATNQATLDSEMFFQAQILRHADTWEKVATGMPLADGEEKRKGAILYSMLMSVYQNQYYQHKSGYLENAPDVGVSVALPIYEIWRGTGGARARSPEFLGLLDSQRQEGTSQ